MKVPFRIILGGALSAFALYACGTSASSASSGSGLSQAQVQALIAQDIAPLQQQITALQSEVSAAHGGAPPAVFIEAPNAPASTVKAQLRGADKASSATAACTGLGTLTGRPDNSDPFTSNLLSGVSCTGYYFTVSGAATAAQSADVQPLPAALRVWFDAPNCTGNAYVQGSNVSWGLTDITVANGAVFTAGDPTQASSYWMFKVGTMEATVNVQSVLSGGQCSGYASSFPVYALAPNDPAVSGVPSAPIPGPVTIG